MTMAAHKQSVRDYLDTIINQGRLDSFDRFFADDVTFNGNPNFKQHLGRVFTQMSAAFPDLKVEIVDQIAEGDQVVSRVVFSGTHQGPFNGLAATGRQVRYMGLAMDRFVDGRIVEMWHIADMAALMRQLSA